MFEGQLDDVFMINKALPPEQLEKLRTTEILRLPLDQAACEAEPAQCDDSAFHHKMVLRSGAYIDSGPDGALFLNGTSAFAEVRGHEVFGASRDLFTVEFDVYVFHDGQSSEWGPLLFTRPVDVPESDIDSLDPATFMLALFEGGTVEAHVGEAIEYPPGCHFQIGDYNTWKHVMFRYDRFRSDQGLEEGELEIEGICTVPSSATFFADANSVYHGEPLVIGGARCGGEEHIGMKIRNIVLHRVWVD
jgi:hypothetical protein